MSGNRHSGEDWSAALRALEAEMRQSADWHESPGIRLTPAKLREWADRLAALSTRSEPTGEPETRVDGLGEAND